LLVQVVSSPTQGILFTLWTRDLELLLHDRHAERFGAGVGHDVLNLIILFLTSAAVRSWIRPDFLQAHSFR